MVKLEFAAKGSDLKQSHEKNLQSALDAAQDSQHPSNPIGATLVGRNVDGQGYRIIGHNDVPARLRHKYAINDRIENTSVTVHAETNVILAASRAGLPVDDTALYITDPPCPNCAKNIAASGVKQVFIDQQGFAKDWHARRGRHYQEMSLPILAAAGVDVFSLDHTNNRVIQMLPDAEALSGLIRDDKPDNGTEILYDVPIPATADEHARWILEARKIMEYGRSLPRKGGAVCIGHTSEAGRFVIKVSNRGWRDPGQELSNVEAGKYSFIIDAETRLLMMAARKGLSLEGATLYSSGLPSPRCLLHLVAAGVGRLFVGYEHAMVLRQRQVPKGDHSKSAGSGNEGIKWPKCYLDELCSGAGIQLGFAHTMPSVFLPPQTHGVSISACSGTQEDTEKKPLENRGVRPRQSLDG